MGLAVPQAVPRACSLRTAMNALNVLQVMLLCILGNMIPIPFLLTALRTHFTIVFIHVIYVYHAYLIEFATVPVQFLAGAKGSRSFCPRC